MRHSLAALVVAWAVPTLPAVAEENAGFKVVVPADHPVTSMSSQDLGRVFLLKVQTWEDGTEVFPVDQDASSEVRRAFSLAIHRRSVSAIHSFWQRVLLSGRASPPPVVASDAEVLEVLLDEPGAVGYVSAATPLDSRFRVLDVPDVAGYDVAAPAGGDRGPAAREDQTMGRHGDLRLFLTGSCGPGDRGRQAVLENGSPHERLTATVETSVWSEGWFRASSVGRHALEPLAEERLGCTHETGDRERRFAIVEVSSAASHRRAPADLVGYDRPARESVAVVGSGTCGSGRRGERRSVINRHPWNPVSVAIETRELVGDTVKRRYRKTYRLSPGDSRRLGCSADGNMVRTFTLLEAQYR